MKHTLRSNVLSLETRAALLGVRSRLSPRAGQRTAIALLVAIASSCVTAAAAADESEAAGRPPASVEAAPAPAVHHGSVFVDPLGFLLFGPTVGVEVAANRFSATLYGRWLSAGVLANKLFLEGADSFAFSYGAGLRGRYFLLDNLQGPHAGLGLEFVHSTVDNTPALVATKSSYLVPTIEGGYRLPLGSSLYLGGAAAVGYAFQLSSSVENLSGGSDAGLYGVKDQSTIYGSASLELGVYF